jgi:hypothetical protein
MTYFSELKRNWKITNKEQQEMQRLIDFIRTIDNRLHLGNPDSISMEEISEVHKAEKKLLKIRQQIKKRRKCTFLGKKNSV